MSKEVFEIVYSIDIENLMFALKWTLVYLLYLLALYTSIPSKRVEAKLNEQTIKEYFFNGLNTYLITTVVISVLYLTTDFSLIPLITHFYSFLIIAHIFALSFAIYLFLNAENLKEKNGKIKKLGFKDFIIGVDLNPQLFHIDLKTFIFQPALIAIMLMIIAFAEYQYLYHVYISVNMKLYVALWYIYVLMHFIKEESLTTSWDVREEKLGFMFFWAYFVALPFGYSVSGWTLVDTAEYETSLNQTTNWRLNFLTFINILGQYMMHGSNYQKMHFKSKTINVKNVFLWWNRPIELIDDKILCSGFWRFGRHLNYTGDVLFYLSIGFLSDSIDYRSIVLVVFVLAVLVDRAFRDEKYCNQKYKDSWKKYCNKAKFCMIPFVF